MTGSEPTGSEPAASSPRLSRVVLIVFVAGVVVLGLVSAVLLRSRPVRVVVPDARGAAADACHRLHGRLPATVAGQPRLGTDPVSDQTAAWGGAPIVLRCGVGAPAGLQPTSDLTTIDGIDWFAEPVDGGSRYTTVGRVADIEVSVPRDYQPAADVLVELGPVIGAADPALAAPSP